MKQKFLIQTVAICVAGLLMAGRSIARQASTGDSGSAGAIGNSGTSTSDAGQSSASSSAISASPSGPAHCERLSQLMGATIKDQQGNSIGQINDFVVNPMSGRIQFAIISLSEQSGKLTAVPWQFVRPGSDPTICTLAINKSKLDNAQMFDASTWPDFTQASITRQIYSHYGVQPQGRSFQGGTGSGNYYDSGSGSSSGNGSSSTRNNTQSNSQGNQQRNPQSNP